MDLPRLEVLGLIVLPLIGAVLVAAAGARRREEVRWIGLGTALVSLVLSMHLAAQFMHIERTPADAKRLTFQPHFVPGSPGTFRDPGVGLDRTDQHGTSWTLLDLGQGAVQFYVGLDGLNIWLVVLTAVLSVSAVLISWNVIEERVNEFYAWLLALQTAMMGIFLAFDIVLFYVFFEFSLVPLFFLIGIWGGPERRHAAGKFFIYTIAGSLIALLGLISIVLACKSGNELTFSIPRLVELVQQRVAFSAEERAYWTAVPSFGEIVRVWLGRLRPEEAPERWGGVMFWVFIALSAGFAVKVPLIPLHTWLPLAHVEAPTAGSVLLAGVLLKVGAYGFLRLCVPLAPDASLAVGLPLINMLAAIGIIYGALCSYAQDDIKKLVAYSSVSHLGMCMLGLFALNAAGLAGGLMQMINHGLSTGALFLLVGMLYERYHTRKISDYGGMSTRLPLLGAFMVFVCLTSVGLPGLNGFIGEALILFGSFEQQYVTSQQFPWFALAGAAGMVLGAWYLFTMLQRVFFGELKEPVVVGHHSHEPIRDLNPRELCAIVPIMVLCLVIGVYPQPMLDTIRPDLETVSRIVDKAREREVERAQRQAPVDLAAKRQEEQP